MRLMLRKAHYQDDFSRLRLLYKVGDPWNMDSEKEKFRFRETNRVILSHLGKINRLLEIGSGEGHQTVHFAKIATASWMPAETM